MTVPVSIPASGPPLTSSAAIRRRYSEIVATLDWWRTIPRSLVPDDDHDAARHALVTEARLLDDNRLDDWLDGWDHDGILWVPIDEASNPGDDQSFFLDDVRRMRERMDWRRRSSAWSQRLPVRTVRSVTNIESRLADDGALHTRSTLTILEQRGQTSHLWAGHQFHVLGAASGGARLRRLKVLCVPALRAAVPYPGVLL